MIIKLKSARKIESYNDLKDVIVNVKVLVKEFDDSEYIEKCKNEKTNPDISKLAFETEISLSLPTPSKEEFISISDLTSDIIISWIESNEKIMNNLLKDYNYSKWKWDNTRKVKPKTSVVEF